MGVNMLEGLAGCSACPLHENGFVVPGDGPVPCKVMVLGEAPGREENFVGKPFIGAAGKKLEEYLELAGYQRADIYLANSVKHWPGEGNPTPKAPIIKACRHWLDQEIEMVDPDLIICLGATAAKNILGAVNIKRMHGRGVAIEVGGRLRTVYVTYHPAAGLHSPGLVPTIRKDFEEVKRWIADYHNMEVVMVRRPSDLNPLIYNPNPYLAIDLETTSLDVQTAEITSVALSTSSYRGYSSSTTHLMFPAIQAHINSGLPLIVHNGPYDLPILSRHGIAVTWANVWDTMVSGYVLGKELALKTRALREHNIRMETYEEVAGREKDSSVIDPWRLLPYNACDTAVTALLYEHDVEEIKANGATDAMEIERRLTPVLLEMKRAGVRFDREAAGKLGEEFQQELTRLEGEAEGAVGLSFNINSVPQVRWLLFDKLELKPVKKSKESGEWSTDEEVLKKLYAQHPVVPLILEYRKYQKMKGTYIDSPLELSSVDGRLHTDFKQTGARGGRMSSANPNMQNQPSRGKWGKLIRALYLPDNDDEELIAADAGQLELRVAAALSGDQAMMAIFNEGRSIHMETLHTILMRPDLGKNSDEYKLSKNVNFGMTYRMSPVGLQRYLINECEPPIYLTLKQCKAISQNFLGRFPTLISYQDELIRMLLEDGYVQNLFGHRRYLPEVWSDDRKAIEDACKIGVNLPVQGTAGAAIKKVMAEVQHYPLRINVHDELVLSVPKAYVLEVEHDIQIEMERGLEEVFNMKMVVECGHGVNWSECK